MMIPDDYYGDVEPVEIEVRSLEDAAEASEKAGIYMKKHGSGNRIATFASLAVEELAGNVIRYGFGDGKSRHINVKLKKDGDQWILRLRDDCPDFDPVLYARNITPEQKESHYGIRMIYSLADEVTYLNTLNLNNLIIRFR
jgi:anti-sigma regulatory factor (Ser/Thr protein kinase)